MVESWSVMLEESVTKKIFWTEPARCDGCSRNAARARLAHSGFG